MLGAVLETVNVRLSREQIVFCLNHAEASCSSATSISCRFRGDSLRVDEREEVVWASDAGALPAGLAGEGEYEDFIARGDPAHPISRTSTRIRARRSFIRPGRRACPRASPSRTASSCCTRSPRLATLQAHERNRLHADDADVPRARLGFALRRDACGLQTGLSGTLFARRAAWISFATNASPSRTACRRFCRCCLRRRVRPRST